MADIARYPLVRHLRGAPTVHVRHLRRGKVVHDGVGLSFWFRPLTAVLSELPVDDREVPLLFHARTADFQDVTVQMTVSYRLADPANAAQRLDFSIDPDTGMWRGTPLQQIAGLLMETAQQHALDLLARTALVDALADGWVRSGDGWQVVWKPILVWPRPGWRSSTCGWSPSGRNPRWRRRCRLRRGNACSRTRIEPPSNGVRWPWNGSAPSERTRCRPRSSFARREEQLVSQQGANARRTAEEEAAAAKIANNAWIDRERQVKEVKAEGIRAVGNAEADVEAARLAAYRELDQHVLLGLALKELAANLPKVDSLVLTPDLIAPVLARLGAAPTAPEVQP